MGNPEIDLAVRNAERDLDKFREARKARLAEVLTAFQYIEDPAQPARRPTAEEYGIILQAVTYVLADDTLMSHMARIREYKKLLDSYGKQG